MAIISQIEVTVETGERGSNGRASLGFGGREFVLDTSANDLRPRSTSRFVLGHDANVRNAARNDPGALMPVPIEDVGLFPAYLRLDGSGPWDLAGVRAIARAGVQAVSFAALPGTERLVLGDATGRRVFLEREAVNVSALAGTVVLKIDNSLTPKPIRTSVEASLVFSDGNTRVEASVAPLSDSGVTVTQAGRAVGTFDPATGRLDLPVALHFDLPDLIFVDSDVSYALTTESAGALAGARLNRDTGAIRLVAASRFVGGTLDGSDTTIEIDGFINPVF
jgi:hypothetical protein